MNNPLHSGNSALNHSTLSVIVPVFNEADVLTEFHRRLCIVLENLSMDYEIVYVDDGSTDRSRNILETICETDTHSGLLRFSRNFGKEQALTAGLHAARGELVILLDSDLQHPPEVIPQMIQAQQTRRVDMVNMRRRNREGESWRKRTATGIFYKLINCMSNVLIPADVGDFRLLTRRAVDALNQLEERNRFMKGLFAWIGFQQITLEFDVEERHSGISKWRFKQLWNFAIDGLVAFSVAPLKIASYVGMLSALGAFFYGAYFLVITLVYGDPVPGFPTLIVTILFIGGLQLMAIGILGEYLGRLFIENKRRPLYLVEERILPKNGLRTTGSAK